MFRRPVHAVLPAVATVAVAAVALTACSSGSGADTGSGGSSSTGGSVSVVASTDVWGNVVSQIGGNDVKVTSIITNPDADPHSYEADANVKLDLSRASVVVENGGGYDDFMEQILGSLSNKPNVLNAVDISGKTAPAGGDLNEHVWYDFPTVQAVAAKITDALSQADPSNASTFQANAKTFDAKLTAMEQTEATIKAAHSGAGVAITEPVPLYMLQACGLDNKTPSEFSEAIEEGTDVPASVEQETLALFTDKQVKLLAYNEQTSGPETEQVLSAAKSNNVAVVPVTETLPSGKDYLTWMSDNLSAISQALGG